MRWSSKEIRWIVHINVADLKGHSYQEHNTTKWQMIEGGKLTKRTQKSLKNASAQLSTSKGSRGLKRGKHKWEKVKKKWGKHLHKPSLAVNNTDLKDWEGGRTTLMAAHGVGNNGEHIIPLCLSSLLIGVCSPSWKPLRAAVAALQETASRQH